MWTIEELEELEQLQYEMSTEEFALLVTILLNCRNDIKKEILSFYEKYGSDGVVTYIQSRKRVGEGDNRKRIVVLHETIDTIFDSYFIDLDIEFERFMCDIIQTEIDKFGCMVDVEDILNMKWGTDNLSWRTRLYNHKIKWSSITKRKLKLAFLRGDDLNQVVKDLYDTFENTEKVLRALQITEYNAIESETRYRIFKELGYKEYQYYATLDERTCDTCGDLHGRVFPMTAFEIGATVPPIHTRCRCFMIPIEH